MMHSNNIAESDISGTGVFRIFFANICWVGVHAWGINKFFQLLVQFNVIIEMIAQFNLT